MPVEDARIGLAGPLWGMAAALASYLGFPCYRGWVLGGHRPFGRLDQHLQFDSRRTLDGGRGFRALSRNQALLITAAVGSAWFLSHESMILLVAIVAFFQSLAKPKDAEGDRVAFICSSC